MQEVLHQQQFYQSQLDLNILQNNLSSTQLLLIRVISIHLMKFAPWQLQEANFQEITYSQSVIQLEIPLIWLFTYIKYYYTNFLVNNFINLSTM